ncbi:DUF4142 domain-containing protein [Novosphingobium sp. JCM 18896]|uniref:DUF4142 domain-containing protein n=1 Tax=Novosphingobium sp. JCM 18896 TaxID=2989731 RepID=UPI002223A9FB|nr:DUF4142 domain-containing protein [Novosphingobium sp. JCM 18896]MCW1430298.1 DUF4142 domain-containing protein [Novosphingobium sp. JCM 18896]
MPKILPAVFALSVLGSSAAMATATSPADYVAKAGSGDLYERQSSELVLQSTKDPAVRDFAEKMVADHAKSTADVTAAARQAGLQPSPPSLDAEQSLMIAELRAAKDKARDSAYLRQQRTAHQKALELHRSYAVEGTSAPLKAVATAIVPIVEQHQQHLERHVHM